MQHSHQWSPIKDLPADWQTTLVDKPTEALVQSWQDYARDLREQDVLKQFLARLQRQWAIETGVLEDLYQISEGATLTLIQKGLDASLLSHGDTDLDPQEVVIKIQDQLQAIMGLYQFVGGERPLGTSYVKELHQVLTAHQETYAARDTLGNPVNRTLPKGSWKTTNNHVEHFDGTRFEYCPYEHVAQEMENLLAMHEEHVQQKVPANVEAAWLHHRFSLIHPFVDGNGRVARCLATLVLLKDYWLPLVVTRHHKPDYIQALRAADNGDLLPLVQLFSKLQRGAIREATSLTEEVIQHQAQLNSILADVEARIGVLPVEQSEALKLGLKTADELQQLTFVHLQDLSRQIEKTMKSKQPAFRADADDGSRVSGSAKDARRPTIECATQLGYFANLSVYQAWAALNLETDLRSEILFSFHGIGRTKGILGCSAMFYQREYSTLSPPPVAQITPIGDEPFEFAVGEELASVEKRFRKWMEECTLVGLQHWKNSI